MPDAPHGPAIAFFDVDNTLLRGASLYHVGIGAWRSRYISGRDIAGFVWKQARFVAVGENRSHIEQARRRALDVVVGRSRDELVALSHQIFDSRLMRRLWPETVAVAARHLAEGREVWLVTATAQEVADVIAERLGLTGAIGTVLECVDGVFTGALSGPVMHGAHKAEAAAGLARAADADLADCWAYSDSHNDIPLLSLVGHPVVVNPDTVLRRYATERHWPVMLMRPASIKAAVRASKKR
ncbi:HAD family hydrolase [Glaciibacter sp. 2TAF33]|uniref:HAD family hydrolase n=1 Tax=Glaciibacter sp. 2TAF33 TaxID=3233015 RepID=UPI003F912176